ncbi:hypothetical protein E2C01_036458 [Portunus trituberculatus]|uniref:Uncharacterized protein n=1 Tax=Portunus trituberculatus TaxID=210409 RepID=A0A5B7FBZ5_PORTR|nr:hypothetical protein [Portunus trituberculatus]
MSKRLVTWTAKKLRDKQHGFALDGVGLSVTFEHAIGSGAQFMCWELKELKDDIGLKELKRYCCPIVVDIAAIAIMVKTRTIGVRWSSSSGSNVEAGN